MAVIQANAIRAAVPQGNFLREDKSRRYWIPEDYEKYNKLVEAKQDHTPLRVLYITDSASTLPFEENIAKDLKVDLAVTSTYKFASGTEKMDPSDVVIKKRLFGELVVNHQSCKVTIGRTSARSLFTTNEITQYNCISQSNQELEGTLLAIVKVSDNSYILAVLPSKQFISDLLASYIDKFLASSVLSSEVQKVKAILVFDSSDCEVQTRGLQSHSFAKIFPLDNHPEFLNASIYFDKKTADAYQDSLVPSNAYVNFYRYQEEMSENVDYYQNLIADFDFKNKLKIAESKAHLLSNPTDGSKSSGSGYNLPFIGALVIFIPCILILAAIIMKMSSKSSEDDVGEDLEVSAAQSKKGQN